MPKFKLSLPSPAFVLALIALFAAVGGVGYAAGKLKKDSVGAKQIKANAVRSSEIKDGSVGSAEVADRSIGADDLAAGAVPVGPAGFAAFRDGSVSLNAATTAQQPIATLRGLPAGSYAITAKTVARASQSYVVNCRLQAPPDGAADSDEATASMPPNTSQTIAMQLVHTFPSDGGEVQVTCGQGAAGAGIATTVEDTKIQAIRLGSVSNVAVTG